MRKFIFCAYLFLRLTAPSSVAQNLQFKGKHSFFKILHIWTGKEFFSSFFSPPSLRFLSAELDVQTSKWEEQRNFLHSFLSGASHINIALVVPKIQGASWVPDRLWDYNSQVHLVAMANTRFKNPDCSERLGGDSFPLLAVFIMII